MDELLQKLKIALQQLNDLLPQLFPRPNHTEPIANNPMNTPVTPPEPPPVPQVTPKYDWSAPPAARHSLRLICDEEGLTTEQKNLMSQVVHCESGYLPGISVHNCLGLDGEIHSIRADKYNPTDGKILSTDYGICQWNDKYHGEEISPDEAKNDPEKAVRLMCQYVKKGQIKQWVCYSSGLYHSYSA